MLKSLVARIVSGMVLAYAPSVTAGESGPEQFAGTWRGKGVHITNGEITLCSLVEIIFASDGTDFANVGGKRICETHQMIIDKDRAEVRDGKLIFRDQVIGGFEGNTMYVMLVAHPKEEKSRTWRMSMRREGDTLIYEDSRSTEGDTTPHTSFAALMTLQRN
jgi:hypothetical protein